MDLILDALDLTEADLNGLVGGNHRWSKGFGGPSTDVALDVATDADDNIVIAGYFYSTSDFGGGTLTSAGSGDIFVAKYDTDGNHVWSQRFGGTNFELAQAVATDAAGNVLLVGRARGTVDFGGGPLAPAGQDDIVVAKLDAAGTHVWSKRFGGTSYEYAQGVAVDPTGDVVLTGYFNSTNLDFGGGPLAPVGGYDIFAAKLDGASGGYLWADSFGGFSSDVGTDVAVDLAGDVLVTGYFYGAVDFGGGILPTFGSADGYVLKLSSAAGSHVWSRSLGGNSNDQPRAVTTDGNNDVLVTGYFSSTNMSVAGGPPLVRVGGNDIFVAKLGAATGGHVWSRGFGGTSTDVAYDLARDADNNVFVVGRFASTNLSFDGPPLTRVGSYDLFLAKLDPGGSAVWSRSFGGTSFEHSEALAVDADGNPIVTGYFSSSSLSFGGGPVARYGSNDVFLAKLRK